MIANLKIKKKDNENNNFYKNYEQEMILRDVLAADRTILANERTILAYLRTSLSFGLSGLSFIKLFPSTTSYIAGIIFGMISLGSLFVGVRRYIKVHKDLSFIRK